MSRCFLVVLLAFAYACGSSHGVSGVTDASGAPDVSASRDATHEGHSSPPPDAEVGDSGRLADSPPEGDVGAADSGSGDTGESPDTGLEDGSRDALGDVDSDSTVGDTGTDAKSDADCDRDYLYCYQACTEGCDDSDCLVTCSKQCDDRATCCRRGDSSPE